MSAESSAADARRTRNRSSDPTGRRGTPSYVQLVADPRNHKALTLAQDTLLKELQELGSGDLHAFFKEMDPGGKGSVSILDFVQGFKAKYGQTTCDPTALFHLLERKGSGMLDEKTFVENWARGLPELKKAMVGQVAATPRRRSVPPKTPRDAGLSAPPSPSRTSQRSLRHAVSESPRHGTAAELTADEDVVSLSSTRSSALGHGPRTFNDQSSEFEERMHDVREGLHEFLNDKRYRLARLEERMEELGDHISLMMTLPASRRYDVEVRGLREEHDALALRIQALSKQLATEEKRLEKSSNMPPEVAQSLVRLNRTNLAGVRRLGHPPATIQVALQLVYLILELRIRPGSLVGKSPLPLPDWTQIRTMLTKRDLATDLPTVTPMYIAQERFKDVVRDLRELVLRFQHQNMDKLYEEVGHLWRWCLAMLACVDAIHSYQHVQSDLEKISEDMKAIDDMMTAVDQRFSDLEEAVQADERERRRSSDVPLSPAYVVADHNNLSLAVGKALEDSPAASPRPSGGSGVEPMREEEEVKERKSVGQDDRAQALQRVLLRRAAKSGSRTSDVYHVLVTMLRREIHILQSERDSMSDGFRVQLLDLRQRLQDAEARGESSEADAKALEEKIGAMETSTTTLQESLRGLSAEKETLTLRLEEKHTAIEDLVRDAAAKDADMARRMEELSGQKARAEEHVTALSRDKARLDEELQAERDRNHSAEEQAAGEAASAAQRESVLASALRAAEAKVSELSGKKAVLEENHRCEVAKLEADCVQAQAETKAAAERLLAVEASQEALQRELAQLRAEKARIEQQLEEELERSRSSSKAGAVANAVSQLLVAEASRNQTQEELDRLQQGNGSSSSEGQGDEGAAEEEGGGGEEPTEASSSSNTAHEEGCSCGGDGDKLKACEEREADLKKELARALKEKNEALERLQQALNGGDHAIATRAIRVEDASGQQQPTASAAQLITCIHDLTRENESLGKHRENQTKVIVELTQSVEEADSYLRLSWGVIGVFLFVVLLWVRWFYLFDVAWLHPMRKENVTLCAADECDVAVSGLSLEGRLLVGENLTVRAFQCGGRQCGEVSRAASMVRSLSGGGAGDPSYTALVGAWTVERATVSSSKRQHSAQQSQMLLDAQQQVQHLQESMDQKQQAQIQQLDDLRQQLHDQQKQHVSELARQENLEQDKQRQLQEAQQQLQKVQKEHQAELQKLNKAHAQELQQQGQQLQAQQRQHAQELQQQDQQLQAQLKQQSQQLDLQVKLQDQSAAHAKELGKLRDELQAEQKAHIQELVDQEQLRQSKQHQLQEVEQQMQQVVKQHTVELQQQEKQFKQQIQVLEQVDNKKQAQLSELERKLKDQDKKLKEEQAKKAKPCPAANCPKPPPVAKKQRTNEIQTAALMRNGSTFWLNRGSDEAPDLRFLVLGSLASLALSLASKAHRFALFLPWGAAAGAATLAPVSSLIPAAFSASASPAASTAAGTIVVRPAVVWLQRFAGVILPATLGWCGQVTAGLVLASTVALVSDQGAGSGEPADQSSPLPFPPSPSPAPSPPQEERERPRVRDFSRTAPMSYRGGVAFPSDENGLGQRVQVALGPLVAVAQTVVSWARRLFHSGPFKVPETEDARRV